MEDRTVPVYRPPAEFLLALQALFAQFNEQAETTAQQADSLEDAA